ncbi:Major facilitator superfamily MFS 1 protein [Salinisphaera shabanensis E1L3A]|uniref:Major facilitator superfamily MFS 1 protein n=1 Tax=Salinisphaera shabanensis E1L3A TaxID=1033802 RepID=U2EP22_9GAMM|nr:MFS transporter [Salinisphaera shabanensis]ERJ19555.1 Major facilitator superfamily MFS 1 protein [Salinisphaera shabanensis E1L3A]
MAYTIGSGDSADRRLLGLSWSHFLNDGAATFLPGILPALLIQMQLSVSLAGTIMAALLVGQGLQPLVGLLGDRFGGRTFVVLGLLGSSAGGAMIGFVETPSALIGVLVLIGISNSLFHPQALAGVRLLAHERQGSAMSFFLVGGEIGRGVWPALASLVVVHIGMGYLWLLSIPALFTLPLLWHWAPSLARRQADTTPIAWRAHAGPLTGLVLFCALRALIIFTVITFVPVLWSQAGGGLTAGASFITVLMVVGVIGNLGGGRLADSKPTRPILVAAMLISSALLVAFVLLDGVWLWLVLAALGVALFSTLPLTILIAQDILPENRSFGSGLALGLANAIGALAVIALGPVAAHCGAAAPLEVAAVCGVIAGLLALWLPQHKTSAAI